MIDNLATILAKRSLRKGALELQLLCALVRGVAQPGESSNILLSEKMSAEFEKRESIVKFFTGIRTAENKQTGRIESLEENTRTEKTKPARKKRKILKCRLS